MRTIILSDLHFGPSEAQMLYAGGSALSRLIDQQPAGTHLLFNGDAFDFLPGTHPLTLDVTRAVEHAHAIVRIPIVNQTLTTLGQALARGCTATIRLGNHDVELALLEVQEVFRAALAQPAAVAERLRFELGATPGILEIGGVRILYTHGEHDDNFNRVDYERLEAATRSADPSQFVYPAGSQLVRQILDPLRSEFRMRFADFLKPDVQGAALAALAVDPAAMKVLFQRASWTIAWQVLRNVSTPISFAEDGAQEPDLQLYDRLQDLQLTEQEQQLLNSMLSDDPAPVSFGPEEAENRESLRGRLLRTGLQLYARAHRSLAVKQGLGFFSLDTPEAELHKQRELARRHQADAVVRGHTHAARWHHEPDFSYVNTGTWIWLLRLPGEQTSEQDWLAWLEELRGNPELLPERQHRVRPEHRLSVCIVEPHPEGGARLTLAECLYDGTLNEVRSAQLTKK